MIGHRRNKLIKNKSIFILGGQQLLFSRDHKISITGHMDLLNRSHENIKLSIPPESMSSDFMDFINKMAEKIKRDKS